MKQLDERFLVAIQQPHLNQSTDNRAHSLISADSSLNDIDEEDYRENARNINNKPDNLPENEVQRARERTLDPSQTPAKHIVQSSGTQDTLRVGDNRSRLHPRTTVPDRCRISFTLASRNSRCWRKQWTSSYFDLDAERARLI